MDSENSTNPAHKRKHIDLGNKEFFAPKSPLLSSPPFEHPEEYRNSKNDQPPASPAPDTPAIDTTQSTSEIARERYLKQDPLALVLSPSCVECRQCRKKIKLSSKSAYDTFHWRNHRTRCMKAHKRKVKAMSIVSTSKKSLTPPLSTQPPLLNKDSLMHTPPLISDGDDDRVSDGFGERITDSPTLSSPFASPKQELSFACSSQAFDSIFDDYLRRSHPDYAQPASSVQSAGRWRNWSWSQLKPPRFPVADYDNHDEDMDEDLPYSFKMPSDIFHRAAASSMSFIS